MEVINQSHEILSTFNNIDQIPALIEIAGRTCYKSDAKITKTSAEKFCRQLVLRRHEAMIEHSNVIVEVPKNTYKYIRTLDMDAIRFLEFTNYQRCVISGNVRAWKDLLRVTGDSIVNDIVLSIASRMMCLFNDTVFNQPANGDSGISILSTDELTRTEKLNHMRLMVRFITNRGTTHELVRHRPASFAQESTRFVNYKSKDIKYIRPVFEWAKDADETNPFTNYPFTRWVCAMKDAEDGYRALAAAGYPAQEVRGVLPIDLKAEIIVTANVREWIHIFHLRTAKDAHPQIQGLMKPLKEELKEKYDVFKRFYGIREK